MRVFLRAIVVFLAVMSLSGSLSAQEAKSPAPPAAENTVAPAEWLLGDWVFDEEYTKKKQAEAKKEPSPADLAGSLVTSQLITQLQGAKLMISKQEFTMTTKDGNGKSYRYTALKAPDANTVLLKDEKGEVTGFHRDGERIWMTSTGSVNEPFYFKRTQ